MNVRWTDRSRQHLRAIRDYIAGDSLKYANRTVDRITRKGDGLERFPMSGHTVPESRTRQFDKCSKETIGSSTGLARRALKFWP